MLDDNPALKERLAATATFSVIAVAAVAGFELVISGRLDVLTPGREVREVAPSTYVTVHRVPWSPQTRLVPLSSTEPLFAGETDPLRLDQLAGGYDDADAPDGGYPAPSAEEDLYREIEALYAQEGAYASSRTEYEPAAYEESFAHAGEPEAYARPGKIGASAEDAKVKAPQ